MTDQPRFSRVPCRPEEAHRRYHGGRAVDLVLGTADRWVFQRPKRRTLPALIFKACIPIALVLPIGSELATVRTMAPYELPQYPIMNSDGSAEETSIFEY